MDERGKGKRPAAGFDWRQRKDFARLGMVKDTGRKCGLQVSLQTRENDQSGRDKDLPLEAPLQIPYGLRAT